MQLIVVRPAEHPAEQRHVGDEREHVEEDRRDDPVPDPVVELVDGLLDADELRQQDVDRDHDQHDEQRTEGQFARVAEQRLEASDLLVLAAVLAGVVERWILVREGTLITQMEALLQAAALLRRHHPARGSSR